MDPAHAPVVAIGVASLFALLILWVAMRARRRRRLLTDIPTSKTQGVFIGFVELKGRAEARRPLTTYLSGTPCIWYRWSVTEHWSRTVTESYTDEKGNRKTRTRTESGWKTVAEGGEQIVFQLRDDTGTVQVVPAGADVEPLGTFDQYCGRSDALYYSKGPPGAVMDSQHRRHFSEESIPVGTPLYVVGQARERRDVVAPEIAADPNAPMFLISTRSEQKVESGLGWQAIGWEVFGALLMLAGGIISVTAAQLPPTETQALIIPRTLAVFAAYVGAWATVWTWSTYNALVNLRQRVRQAWSLVDVELKRRNDLIPRLVDTVRGAAGHEASTLKEVAELRSQLDATPPGQSGPDHRGCAGIVRAVAERYPDLKVQPLFMSLQKELINTEQRIALARAYFNDIASFYNTRLEQLPDRFVAAGLKPQALMTASDFERAPVVVQLDPSIPSPAETASPIIPRP